MPQQITLDQKRLEQLRRQLQSRGQSKVPTLTPKVALNLPTTAASPTHHPGETSDSKYLKQDLGKIFVLATLALIVQIGLFIGLHHGLKIPGLTS